MSASGVTTNEPPPIRYQDEPNAAHENAVALMDRLTRMSERAKADGRGLDVLDLVLARDAVEMLDALMIEIRGHRGDSNHLHFKDRYPKLRMADRMLYELAGFDPLEWS